MSNETSENVLIVLRKIIRAISLRSKKLSQEFGITTPQLLVLRAIAHLNEPSISALSKEVSLSQATITAIIDRLEKRDIVKRVRSQEDRRRVHVNLTEEGKSILDEAPSPLQESFQEAFGKLDEWEQTLILSSLQRVAKMMNAEELAAAPLLFEESQLPRP